MAFAACYAIMMGGFAVSEKKRSYVADILKGICIILVVINHFHWQNDEGLLPIFPYLIGMAVPIFMILSGYVYSIAYESRAITSIRQVYSIDYIIDKLARYTIPFVIVYIMELIAFYRLGNQYGMGEIIWTFMNGGFGFGSYYFPIMIQFIFVFPFIYFLIKRFEFSGLLLCGLFNALFEILQRAYFVSEMQYRLLIFRYLLLIAFGCYLYLRTKPLKRVVGIVSMLCGGLFLWAVCYGGYVPPIINHWTRTSFVAALYIMPIIGLVLGSEKCSRMRCKPLEYLGKASYHIFLMQMFFYQFLAYPIEVRLADVSSYIRLLISIVVCICCGILFYVIETRITRILLSAIHHFNLQRAFNRALEYINVHVSR